MVEEARNTPGTSAAGAARAAGREARLAAALRDNLSRRKVQARRRDAEAAGAVAATEPPVRSGAGT
jgi:hypothetical protein